MRQLLIARDAFHRVATVSAKLDENGIGFKMNDERGDETLIPYQDAI
jgi:hypothetical protein